MEELTELLGLLSRLKLALGFDPARLVALHKAVPLWTAGLMVGAGLLTCMFGSGKLAFRFVLLVPALAAGYALGPWIAKTLHLAPTLATYGATGGLALLALAFPPAFIGLGVGLGGGLLGGELVSEADFWMGFLPGLLIAGGVGFVAARFLSMVISGIVGAASLSLGAVALLTVTPLGGLAVGFPSLTVAAAAGLAVLSIAYQVRFTPTEEEVEKRRAEKAHQKQLTLDAKERDKRFKKYAAAPKKRGAPR